MGEKSESRLMYSLDGKEYQEISHPTIDNSDIEFINTDIDDFGLNSSTMSGSFSIKLSKKQSRRIAELLTPREFTNNWLKRHGLPMRRKYHGRRK